MQHDKEKKHLNKQVVTHNIKQNNESNKLVKLLDKEHVLKTNIEYNTELYKNVILDEYIYLKASDLNHKIDDIILLKLKKKVEGKCIKIGYVMPDSIKIVMRSLGIINNANFEGITTYKIKFTADICNPVIGQHIQCEVGNIDKSQIICYIDTPDKSPVEIYLFKHHHLNNTEFTKLQVNNIIHVKIVGSKWEYKDRQITTIAQYITTA